MIILLFLMFAQGEVKNLIMAQNSHEILHLHQSEVRQRLLRERCDVELRQQWMPNNCFEWLQSSSLTASEKKHWFLNLKKKCEQAVQKSIAEGKEEQLFRKKKLPKACMESLEPAFLNWRYRLSRDSAQGLTELEIAEQIGKDFERLHLNESESQKNNRRVPYRRALGRGLN